MFRKIKNFFSINNNPLKKGKFLALYKENKNLISRIIFTLFIIVLIRFLCHLTVPGITVNKNTTDNPNNFLYLISLLGGGTIGRFSIIALGVSPYITASIIVQLLSTDVIPIMSRWAKSGEKGRKKLDRLNRIFTIPFAIMQGIATIFTMEKQNIITPSWVNPPAGGANAVFYYFLVSMVLVAGTMFMLWIGDQITKKGIGNGISVIIAAGIVARLPFSIKSTYNHFLGNNVDPSIFFNNFLWFLIYMITFLCVIFFVVVLNETQRRIPIQQTGSGLAKQSQDKTFLPLRLNCAGVIPVIFASALITAPITISQIIVLSNPTSSFVWFVNKYMSFNTYYGVGLYAILIILFAFLYSQVQINPEKVAENFKKSGKFIPGIPPGIATEKYLTNVVNRLSFFGSFGLAFVAVLPYIVAIQTKLPSSLAMGGTGLIIMVSVCLQTIRQVKGRLIQQKFALYKNFTNNSSLLSDKKNPYLW